VILSLATTKGGPGKTTLAMCLADYWRRQGVVVECLDSDPNKNLTSWLGASSKIQCTAVSEDDVVDEATRAADRSEVVIIDVAGSLARALVYAISVSDFVLMPARPDAKDVIEASRTAHHIHSSIKGARKFNANANITFAALLTQVNPRARVTAHSREQLTSLGVPVLTAEVTLRTAYQQASYGGSPLEDPAVMIDIAAVVAEIMEAVNGVSA
jgi:chromosome partitioning protein